MRENSRGLVCRCLPLGVVVVVWAAAHRVAHEPDVADQRWYITADGRLSPRSRTPLRPPGLREMRDGEALGQSVVFAARE